MPAIRVSRDNVQITIEIESLRRSTRSLVLRSETNSWQEPHPDFAKHVHELEQVSDGDWAWCDVTVIARFSDLTGTAYLGQCSYKDEADFKSDGYSARWSTKPSKNSSSTSKSCTPRSTNPEPRKDTAMRSI